MRKEKHVQILIDLLKDLRKEPSVSVIGFVYSAALTHMFHIAFYNELETGRAVKHDDFKSKEKINILKSKIHDFNEKEIMFALWKELESKRNELCYGYPDKEDIEYYLAHYQKIKDILERISSYSFE